MDEAFIQNSQDQVNDQDRCDQQDSQPHQRRLKLLGGPFKIGTDVGGKRFTRQLVNF